MSNCTSVRNTVSTTTTPETGNAQDFPRGALVMGNASKKAYIIIDQDGSGRKAAVALVDGSICISGSFTRILESVTITPDRC